MEALDDEKEDNIVDTIDKDLTNPLSSSILVINLDILVRNGQTREKKPTMWNPTMECY